MRAKDTKGRSPMIGPEPKDVSRVLSGAIGDRQSVNSVSHHLTGLPPCSRRCMKETTK
jgi:hypothetical protein